MSLDSKVDGGFAELVAEIIFRLRSNMGMAIDQAGQHSGCAQVDHLGLGRDSNASLGSNGFDFFPLNEKDLFLQDPSVDDIDQMSSLQSHNNWFVLGVLLRQGSGKPDQQ